MFRQADSYREGRRFSPRMDKRDFESGCIDGTCIETADETHFVLNVDNGKTLCFYGDKKSPVTGCGVERGVYDYDSANFRRAQRHDTCTNDCIQNIALVRTPFGLCQETSLASAIGSRRRRVWMA